VTPALQSDITSTDIMRAGVVVLVVLASHLSEANDTNNWENHREPFNKNRDKYMKDGSPVTQDLVDFLYEAIVQVYTNSKDNMGTDELEKEPVAEDRILDGTTFTDLLTSTLNSPERLLDGQTLTNLISSIDLGSTFTTLSGIFGFVTSQLDVLTAISLVRHLENRAMFDPRFRESFPDFLENHWLLPKKKYQLIERRVQGPMPVVHIANKYLHNYNMKHNPDYYKSLAQDKMDHDKEDNYNFYDHQDDNKNHYYSNDNTLANNMKHGTNEDNSDNHRVRRPTPTNFKDLTPSRKKYSQTDFRSSKNQMQDSTEDVYSKRNSFRPYDYNYLQKGQKLSNYEKKVKSKYEDISESSMLDYNHRDDWNPKQDYDHKDYTSASPTFDHFPVKRKDEMSKFDQIYDQGSDEGNLDFLNGVQKGFNSFDPHIVSNKHSNIDAQEEKKNTYRRPYQSSQTGYRTQSPSTQSQNNPSPNTLKRPYKRQVIGRPIIEGQKARNFFPKTNERQPHVDLSGFGPSFNTRFFDALDLHSGFFDHNFPGSPAAEDYKLNFNKPNPQFNKFHGKRHTGPALPLSQPSQFPGPGPIRDRRPGPSPVLTKHPNIFNEISRPLHHSVQSHHKHQNIIVRDSDVADIDTGPGSEEDILEYPIDLGDYKDQTESFDYYDDYSGGSSYQYQAPPAEQYNVAGPAVDYAGRLVHGGQGGGLQINQDSGLSRGPLINDLNQTPGNRPIRTPQHQTRFNRGRQGQGFGRRPNVRIVQNPRERQGFLGLQKIKLRL